jgi:hypothetical protein
MRFELWRRFRSHSDSKNLDSESDDSDSDSKKSESEFLEFNQLQNYKNSDGVGLQSVQHHLHSKNSDSGSQILHSESVGHHWEFARSLSRVFGLQNLRFGVELGRNICQFNMYSIIIFNYM